VKVRFILLLLIPISHIDTLDEQPQTLDFSSFGSSDLVTSRTKSVCDVRVTVSPKDNDTLFYVCVVVSKAENKKKKKNLL
jgi:hypothetical protein